MIKEGSQAPLSDEEVVKCVHCGLGIHFDQGETRHILSGSIFCKKKRGMTLREAEPKLNTRPEFEGVPTSEAPELPADWGKMGGGEKSKGYKKIEAFFANPTGTSVTPSPERQRADKIDVYEVYGSSAAVNGWDFMVCRTMAEALHVIESDLDDLEEGEEVKIVFRRYTAAQMEDVVYE
jgi:hypothetical protein